tara:strand:- start:2117 stop:3250 length:1134 start_codon:yes stop_codon:yes gene_type:complete
MTIAIAAGVLFGLFLAYANGANDNFKGVATLFGSGTSNYRKALLWAALMTALGAIVAIFVANGLLEAFKGKGLVPPEIASLPAFGLSVALAAAVTVMLATRLGFPISTTHALIGGLVGAGLVASPEGIHSDKLLSGFLVPLIVSPVIAVVASVGLYPLFRWMRKVVRVNKETCLCVGSEVVASAPYPADVDTLVSQAEIAMPLIQIGDNAECRDRYTGYVLGIGAESVLDRAHYLSAGAVSFARGLNDAPKIAAIMLVGGALSPWFALSAVTVSMALGGLISARRVAETMSLKVTKMNHGQGFTANLITAFLVIVASRFGMPVSTTHVSCGSLIGIGTITRQANWKTVGNILLAWVVTLPLAGGLAALFFVGLRSWI